MELYFTFPFYNLENAMSYVKHRWLINHAFLKLNHISDIMGIYPLSYAMYLSSFLNTLKMEALGN